MGERFIAKVLPVEKLLPGVLSCPAQDLGIPLCQNREEIQRGER
jgi:hypothetical protein